MLKKILFFVTLTACNHKENIFKCDKQYKTVLTKNGFKSGDVLYLMCSDYQDLAHYRCEYVRKLSQQDDPSNNYYCSQSN